jgi:hypothetical protein
MSKADWIFVIVMRRTKIKNAEERKRLTLSEAKKAFTRAEN